MTFAIDLGSLREKAAKDSAHAANVANWLVRPRPQPADIGRSGPNDGHLLENYVFLVTQRVQDREAAKALALMLMARDAETDDRRMCVECLHLSRIGRCLEAAKGRFVWAGRLFEPVPVILQRCEGFALSRAGSNV